MKKSLPKSFLYLAFFLLFNYADAATFYFSTSTGDDSRSAAQAQNPSTPWKTLSKLNAIFSTLNPGDQVLLKRGDAFYGSIHVTKSGTSGNPIVIGAYGSGPKPVVTSLVSLNQWKSVGNGVYSNPVPGFSGGKINVLLINNVNQELGRFPNSNAQNKGYLNVDAHSGNTSITGNSLSSSPNWTGAEVVIRKTYWILDRHRITSHSGSVISYSSEDGSAYTPRDNFGFFIQNHIKTLDKFGEWYFNPSSKTMYAFFGSKDPRSYQIRTSTLDYLVTNSAYRIKYVTFDNLHFKGANKDAVELIGGTDLRIQNCVIQFSGEDGISVEGTSKLVIKNNKILNSNNNGMYLRSANDAVIKSNLVKDTHLIAGMGKSGDSNGFGIFAPSANNLIEYNEVLNTGYSGIRFGGNSSIVKNNLVDSFTLVKNDGGGIYAYDGSSTSTFYGRKVIGNIVVNGMGVIEGTNIHTLLSKPQAEGIYLDDNVSGVEVTGNTVGNITNKGIYLHNTRGIVLNNNTVYNSGHQLNLTHDKAALVLTGNTIENNLLFSKEVDQNNISISTIANDIAQMASYDNNYYASPLTDNYKISTQFVSGSVKANQTFDLEGWKSAYGKDRSSKIHPFPIPSYKFISLLGNNKYDNGAFDKNVDYVTCNNCKSSWTKKLDEGTLQVSNSGPSSVALSIGPVTKGKNYLLKFSALASKNAVVKVYLRESGAPWQTISSTHKREISSERGEYELLLSPLVSLSQSRLLIAVDEADLTFWMDNIEISEADVEITDPNDNIIFEYNASKVEKTISLDGNYVDVKNNPYSGKVTLSPYSSIILIKTPAITELPSIYPPTVAITSPSTQASFSLGEKVEIQAEAKSTGGTITKVEFFHGGTLLGTDTSYPYSLSWGEAAVGNYSITAKATDNQQKTATSAPVSLVINKVLEGLDPVIHDLTGEVSFDPIKLNAGSSETVHFDGMSFVGDKNFSTYFTSSSTYSNSAASQDALFQTERNGKTLRYTIPVPNGVYTIKTYHNELWFGKAGPSATAGRRVFDISLEGKVVKDNFDIFVENTNKPTQLTFLKVAVNDGFLNLDMVASQNSVTISGLTIELATETTAAPEIDHALYLNAGSEANVKLDGKTFVGDQKTGTYYNSSSTYNNTAASQDTLFQTERNAYKLYYTIPVPNGTYTVKTYHNELWFGKAGPSATAGRRVYDISLEGKLVKENFDLYVENANRPTALVFENIVVKDGTLNLELVASQNKASIAGIAIEGYTDAAANLKINTSDEMFEKEEMTARDEVFSEEIKLYPNPAQYQTTLFAHAEMQSILIHNMNGQLIRNFDPQSLKSEKGKYIIPLSNMPQGLYLVSLVGKKGMIDQLRLIVNP